MGLSGNALRNSRTSGLVATISPTDAACTQMAFLPATLSMVSCG